MGLQVLMAGPASGKTQFGVMTVRECLSGGGLKKIWVVVPEARQKVIFQKRLVQAGGMLGVTIGTFDTVCNQVLLDCGQLLPLVAMPLQHRLIRNSITSFFNRGELEIFESLHDKPGFMGLLHDYFLELQQAGLDPNDEALQGWMENDEQVKVLIRLYAAYQKDLKRSGWQDKNALVTAALQAIDSTEHYSLALDQVVIDGFDHFTRPQRQLISRLVNRNIRVLLTLPGEPASTRLVYRRSMQTLNALQSDHPRLELIDRSGQSFLSVGINGLASGFLNDNTDTQIQGGDLDLLAVQTPAQEVREALRWIKQELKVHAVPTGKCALVVPNLDLYRPLIRAVAQEYGVPVQFNQQEVLRKHPAMAAVLEMMTLTQENYPRRVLIDVLRSPYFNLDDFDLNGRDAERMELVSRYGPVISGLERWQVVLEHLARAEPTEPGLDEDDSEEVSGYRLPYGAVAERLARGIRGLAASLEVTPDVRSIEIWVNWLADLLEQWQWPQRCCAAGQIEVVTRLGKILDGLRLSTLELGEWQLNYFQFVQELNVLLEISEQPENGLQTADAVQILQMIEARGIRFDALAILGLAEGSYPQVERADPFFSEAFRVAFGMEQRLEQDQAGVFFQACTRTNRKLLLSRPYLTAKGESQEPSPFWNAVVSLTGKDVVKTIRPATHRYLNEAASPQELVFWSEQFTQNLENVNEPELEGIQESFKQQRAVLDARLSWPITGPYEGDLSNLSDTLDGVLQSRKTWSASRLETYVSCPMRYWVNQTLQIEEQVVPQPGLQAYQLGSLLHNILELVYAAAENAADPQSVLAALPQVAQQLFDSAPRTYQFEPNALWENQQKEWLTALEKAILELAQGGWLPFAHEQRFGLDGVPPLQIELANGQVIQIRGLIDRVDRNENGELRVVDYKTGSGHLSSDDLINGTRLQLPLYAQAARDAVGLGKPVEGIYWALLAGRAGALKLSSFSYGDFEGPEGAMQVAARHIQVVIDGLAHGDFHPQVPRGGCPEYCPARLWCWRYTPERR